MSSSFRRPDRLVSLYTVLCVASVGLYIILRLLKEMLGGEVDAWRQGDWLINRELVEVRRGPLGSWIIDIADLLPLDPLEVTFGLQAVLTAALIVLVICLFLRMQLPLILAPMVLSPGFFVIFWLADHQGAFRKELIAFLAMMVTVQALWTGRGLLAGALIFCVAVYGHEANALFLPLYLTIFWISRAQLAQGASFWLAPTIAIAGTLHALWYGIAHREISDPDLVCMPLLERGLAPDICNGAINWLSNDLDAALAFVLQENVSFSGFMTLGLMYVLTFLPMFFALYYLTRCWRMWALVVLSAIPFLPLYGIAIDWGRWISLHYFSVVILVFTVLRANPGLVQRQPPVIAVVGLMALSLLWAPAHTLGVHWLWYRWITGSVMETFGRLVG